ncbi:epoxide hydrolase family protein [Arthrobacter sp. B0490]|uniref:epoxide hydrolase family protein n=1 Tax=Arthrobacter sp. B0490 TaxID=2058891 RepID=UPI000CE2C142|nr:epoxide hydrolase family protein [Arthrobacter sp. B0490]
MNDLVRPFQLSIPQSDLDDLHSRLERVRWPDAQTVADHSQGPQLEKIRALVDHWRDSYDWRVCETLLNDFGQYKTEIDGLDIHFLHIRSPEPDALPLLMTHGWPGSVLEFRDVIGPLTDPVAHGGKASDAFHLVIPSLPGHGFSSKPTTTGWGIERTANAWVILMERLGYTRWAAQGGDRGAQVALALGYLQPEPLVGIHLNLALFVPTDEEIAAATAEEKAMLADSQYYMDHISGYNKVHSTRPQSVAYSLADSPVGLAAWMYAMYQDVSDSDGHPDQVFSLDSMIDGVMLYWLPNAGPSSARLYWDVERESPWIATAEKPVPTPTGLSMFPGEKGRMSRRWAESRFSRLVHFEKSDKGGHFASWERPEEFVGEVRTTFRGLRR